MLRIIFVLFALIFIGCGDTGSLYRHDSTKPPAASVTKPYQWRAEGGVYNPQYAIDSDNSTIAYSDSNFSNAVITIDMGKACLFNSVFIDHGSRPDGFAARVAVLTSLDGKNFTLRHESPGTKKVTSICMITPMLARYLRIQSVKPGRQPWSLAEIVIQ